MITKYSSGQQGITLIELLICLSIIAIAFIGLFQLFSFCAKTWKNSERIDIAADIAENLREEILSKPLTAEKKILKNKYLQRINFQTLFDYDNYSVATPENIFGEKYSDYNDYSVKISVKKIKPDKFGNIISAPAEDIKLCYAEIVISIFNNNSILVELPFIKGD